MTWLSLRLQRTEMLLVAAAVGLLTAALVPSGLDMRTTLPPARVQTLQNRPR